MFLLLVSVLRLATVVFLDFEALAFVALDLEDFEALATLDFEDFEDLDATALPGMTSFWPMRRSWAFLSLLAASSDFTVVLFFSATSERVSPERTV